MQPTINEVENVGVELGYGQYSYGGKIYDVCTMNIDVTFQEAYDNMVDEVQEHELENPIGFLEGLAELLEKHKKESE